MKQLIYLSIIFVCSACQNSTKKEETPTTPNLSHPWFKTQQLTPTVWRISDNGSDNTYLIAGTDSALVIDNGIGAVDIRKYISSITTLPLIVINTHGHPDHVGSNNQFNSVYAHPADFNAIKNFTNREMQKQMLQYIVQQPIPDSVKFNDADTNHSATLLPLTDGQFIDLGGRKVEVIHVPGHTPGSICLLDSKEKLLFTGDHIKSEVWLHMEESMSVEIYLRSLQKIQNRSKEYDQLLTGHDSTLNNDYLQELIICSQNIISGKFMGEKIETVVGPGLVCTYKSARIIFDPDKIK